MSASHWIATALTGLLLVLTGCGGGSDPAAPPSGWEASDSRMWEKGVDTSKVFRDLSSLSTMGVIESEFTLSSGSISQAQFKNAIKQSIAELYRSNPTVVDSLFEEHAVPKLEGANLNDAVKDGKLKPKLLNKYKKEAFDAIKAHYRQPSLQGEQPSISPPGSLRTQENSGSFTLQVHVATTGSDSTGAPNAIELIGGADAHPTFKTILMKAATGTKWKPGCLEEDGRCKKMLPGWGRIPLSIPPPR